MRDRVRQSIIVSAGAAALAIALGSAIPALADDRESAESHHAQQQPFEQIQARMQSMHALMTEINRTTDPAARQQLMVQQMQLMRAQMHDMGMMNRQMMSHGTTGCGATAGRMMDGETMHMQPGTQSPTN